MHGLEFSLKMACRCIHNSLGICWKTSHFSIQHVYYCSWDDLFLLTSCKMSIY